MREFIVLFDNNYLSYVINAWFFFLGFVLFVHVEETTGI